MSFVISAQRILESISFAKVNALSGSFKESDEDLHQICWVVQHSLNSTGEAFFKNLFKYSPGIVLQAF